MRRPPLPREQHLEPHLAGHQLLLVAHRIAPVLFERLGPWRKQAMAWALAWAVGLQPSHQQEAAVASQGEKTHEHPLTRVVLRSNLSLKRHACCR